MIVDVIASYEMEPHRFVILDVTNTLVGYSINVQ